MLAAVQRSGLMICCAICAMLAGAAPVDGRSEVVQVRDASELMTALERAEPGTRMRIPAGLHLIDRPLRIPDGVSLEGDGQMTTDDAGRPAGFSRGTATVLRASPVLAGNMLTLNDGASITGLRIEYPRTDPDRPPAARGNIVAIVSRSPGDVVTATIAECELVNEAVMDANAAGPTGRSIVALTLHRIRDEDEPHEDARVSLTVERSVVRSKNWANALFAINFAARGQIAVTLRDNVLEGSAAAAGGVSRRDEVESAVTTITSSRNLYVPASPEDQAGWSLIAGSGSPHASSAVSGTRGNRLEFTSVDDRIEGFPVAVLAVGGRRVNPLSGPISGNRLELLTERLTIRTPDAAADLSLHGALYGGRPGVTTGPYVGNDNVVSVTMRATRGSGRRENRYSDLSGVTPPAKPTGNRVEFTGTARNFAHSNRGIEPQPPTKYFVGDDALDSSGNGNSERFRAFQDP